MLKLIPLVCGIVGLLVAFSLYSWVLRVSRGDKTLANASDSNNDEQLVFNKDWLSIIIIIVVIGVAIGIAIGWICGVLFGCGAGVFLLIEFVSIKVLSKGIRKFNNAEGEESKLFKLAFRTSAAVGLFIASIGLLALGAIFIPLKLSTAIAAIACYGFGACTMALFSNAKFTGVADSYISYLESLISVIILSKLAVNSSGITSTFSSSIIAIFPLLITGVGILACCMGILFVRSKNNTKLSVRMNVPLIVCSVILIACSILISMKLLQIYAYGITIAVGIILGVLSGIFYSKGSRFFPGLLFVATFLVSYILSGLYGMALASIGFVSATAILVAIELYGLVSNTNNVSVKLSSGYSTFASGLTVLAIFVAYIDSSKLTAVNLINPITLACLIIGIMMPMIYVTMTRRSLLAYKRYDYLMKLTALFVPAVIGGFFGVEALGGLLGGLITSGLIISFVVDDQTDSQEEGFSVSISSSINILIKYMTAFSLVFVPIFARFGKFFF